jgi:hypothetical protein
LIEHPHLELPDRIVFIWRSLLWEIFQTGVEMIIKF